MEAREFIKEANRMCKHYYNLQSLCCDGCPAAEIGCVEVNNVARQGLFIKLVDVVEDWSAKHPRFTNAGKFKEVFGLSPYDPRTLSVDWLNEEYKEPKK